MNRFIQILEQIEQYKRQKNFDKAWQVANQSVIDLRQAGDDMWFMMYYQMADILAREGRWFEALEKMGFVIHFLGGVGGATHTKFIKRLLKKVGTANKFDSYVDLCKSTKPQQLAAALNELANFT